MRHVPRSTSGLIAVALAAVTLLACSPTARFTTSSDGAQGGRGATVAAAKSPTAATGAGAQIGPAPIPATAAGTGALAQFQATLERIAAETRRSVVQITTDSGLGSGIVLDSAGDIVTNAHVVSGASVITAATSEGGRYAATLVGAYTQNDLAVIRATNATGLHPALFADSSTVKVGDVVLAVGSPFGLTDTVTEGIVSAVGRSQSEGNGVVLTDLVQITAPINPGNSGGALVNIDGQVIGIPTLSGTDSTSRGQVANGIGFAISSNQVVNITRQLIAGGAVTHTGRAYMGVTTADDPTTGATIRTVVTGGPAAGAGVQAGWVVISVGGHDIAGAASLGQALGGYKPGARVAVVFRLPDGTNRTLTIALGERPVNP